VQTTESDDSQQNIEDDLRQQLIKERELEADRVARDKELEEESVKLEQEIEQEIRGFYPYILPGISFSHWSSQISRKRSAQAS